MVKYYLVQVERRVGEGVDVDVAVPPPGVDDIATACIRKLHVFSTN